MKSLDKVTTDDIQFYLANAARLHPLLQSEFLNRIIALEYKKKVCALPITRLEHYSQTVQRKIAIKLAKTA